MDFDIPVSGEEALDLLRRSDKHYLGAGDGTLFAPPHPLWLDVPGFWDEGQVYLHRLGPLFTMSLVDDGGLERPLRLVERAWSPHGMAAIYSDGEVEVVERRSVRPGGHFVSELDVLSGVRAGGWVVAWTAQETTLVPDRSSVEAGPGGIRFTRFAEDAQRRGEPLAMECTLELEGASGWAVHESEMMPDYPNVPRWGVTPFADRWDGGDGGIGGVTNGESPEGGGRRLLYIGLATRIVLNGMGVGRVRAGMTVRPASPGLRNAAMSPRAPEMRRGSAAAESRDEWIEFFDRAPSLRCSDPWLSRYFAYRWYGLRLNFLDPAGNYRHRTCAEGTDYFHCAISYSAWCHARELRWLPDTRRARGAVQTFLEHQRADGSLPGRVYLDHDRRTDFYIADWGGALTALEEALPGGAPAADLYGPLHRYADWLDGDRDGEGTGLYDVRDPYETGQEYMRRYTAVDAEADRQHFDFRLRLKGVDITVYAYRLRRALAAAARQLGRDEEAGQHDAVAERIRDAVRARMWDPDAGLFFDVDPRTMGRTGVKAAVCFYPYGTDIAGAEHVDGLRRNLFDPATFWTPFPVPSTAADDPTFSADAEWRGVRRSCAWNGRVWPMTNSHVVEALAGAATHDPGLRVRVSELLQRYVRMLCFDGDPARPNCFEHYSPVTGRASVYRGIDDYQHSWINDLVIRFLAGFRPSGERAVVDPFPGGPEELRLDRLPWRGHEVGVAITGGRFRVTVDGRVAGSGGVGDRIEVEA